WDEHPSRIYRRCPKGLRRLSGFNKIENTSAGALKCASFSFDHAIQPSLPRRKKVEGMALCASWIAGLFNLHLNPHSGNGAHEFLSLGWI
ncbi:MAG TPA: hypothetical protein PKX67_08385, partial [Anaerolineaceae bacterium]|nr:hypothetical protein [Anaerolineaceae bacterium]